MTDSLLADITSSNESKLVSPYMKSFMGPMKIIGADLKCFRSLDGTYHYTYTVTAEPLPEKKNDKKKKKETRTETTASFSSCQETARVAYTTCSLTSAILAKDVTFVLLYTGPDGKSRQVTTTGEFGTTATIGELVDYFRQEFSVYIGRDFNARMSMKLGQKTFPLGRDDFAKTIKEVAGNDVGYITIFVDTTV